MLEPVRKKLLGFYRNLRKYSIELALKQQKLLKTYRLLSAVVRDISGQYTSTRLNGYYQVKARALHAFQVKYTLDNLGSAKSVVDIGDSSGNHVRYLKHFRPDITYSSVNLDPRAVDRINSSGGRAFLCDARKISDIGLNADTALSFETLEHLENPLEFLRNLLKSGVRRAIITVPYLDGSRVGLHQIRAKAPGGFGIEDVHIFELCPEDWALLFQYAGWDVANFGIYRQYPSYAPFMKYYWKHYDFEGFAGFTLVKRTAKQ